MKKSFLFNRLAGSVMALIVLAFNQTATAAARKVAPQVLPLKFGLNFSGQIATPAERDQFTFTGAIGQRLYFDALAKNRQYLYVELMSPSGQSLWKNWQIQDNGPFYLLEPGEYTLVVDGELQAGEYQFRMLDVAQVPAINSGAPVSGQLDPGMKADLYQFSGQAGQRVRLESRQAHTNTPAWRLVGPDNQSLLSGSIAENLGELVLPATGTYIVAVEGRAENAEAISYQIEYSVVSNPTGAASGFGVVHEGVLEAGATNSFAYSAPSGTVTFLDSQTNSPGLVLEFADPAGQVFLSIDADKDKGPVWLPLSGAYTLRLRGVDASSAGAFRFRWLNLGEVPRITAGADQPGSLNAGFQTDVYRFDGAVGQRVYLNGVQTGADYLLFALAAPSGKEVFSFLSLQVANAGPFTLTEAGPYLLSVASTTPNASSYTIRLLDSSQAPVIPLAFNTPINGQVNSGKIAMYRFYGQAEQKLFFNGQAENSAGFWTLWGPNNQALMSQTPGSDFPATLPQSGTYLLGLAGNGPDPAAFAFTVISPKMTQAPLTFGALTRGVITEAGERHHFTFAGTMGQRLMYDAIGAETNAIEVRVLDPQGQPQYLNNSGLANYDSAPFTLGGSGLYTLVIGGQTDAVGNYQFRLIDVAQSPARALAMNTLIEGTQNPGTQIEVFRFEGADEQRLFMDSHGTNTSGTWTLYGPRDQQIGQGGMSQDFEAGLTQPGMYVLAIAGASAEPSAYSFTAIIPPTKVKPIQMGVVIVDTLAQPGEEHVLTFSGQVGQRIYYDALDADQDNVTMNMLSPSGKQVGDMNANADFDEGPVTLWESGTYRLILHNHTDQPADYQFQLLDMAQQPVLAFGQEKTAQLKPKSETDFFRFDAKAGQRVQVDLLSPSDTEAVWYILAPDNRSLILRDFTVVNVEGISLPDTGSYLFMVVGYGSNALTLDYGVRLTEVTDTPVEISGLGHKTGEVSLDVDTTLNFTGAAGAQIYFDQLTNTPGNFVLAAPDGTEVFNVQGSGTDFGPVILPRSGDYTLHIKGQDSGAFDFRLLDLSQAALPLEMAKTYTGSMDAGFKTDIYSFSGEPGQQVVYDSLTTNWNAYYAIVRLLAPSGKLVYGGYGAFQGFYYPVPRDSEVITLPEKGTYLLTLENQWTETFEYGFRLIDIARPPAQALPLDAVAQCTIEPQGIVLYRFEGVAKQRLFFDSLLTGDTPYCTWYLYSPNQPSFAGGSIGSDFEALLPETGTYTLRLSSYVDVPVEFRFQVITPVEKTFPLSWDAIQQGTLAEPGEQHLFTFNGTAGQKFYYDALNSGAQNVRVELIDPNGVADDLGWFHDDAGPQALTVSGAHILRLHNQTDRPVDYQFRLVDVFRQPVIELDAVNQAALNPGTQAAVYQLFAPQGLRLFLESQGGNSDGTWGLYGPNDQSVGYQSAGYSQEINIPQTGNHTLVISRELAEATNFSFKVIPGNHAPVLTPVAAQAFPEMVELSVANPATDREQPNDTFHYSLLPGAPEGVAIAPATGLLTWNPTEAQGPSTNTVWVRVSDDGPPNLATTQAVTIVIQEVNRPPVLVVPGQQTINEGQTLSARATATDPDLPINALTFSFAAAPNGANIDPQTGSITWNTAEIHGPSTNTFTVVVTDFSPLAINEKHLSATNSFLVVVNEVNTPPVWTAAPQYVVDELTELVVSNIASDADLPVNTLTYTLVSAPPGAVLNPNTGIFTWTPTETQGPGTNRVTIQVTDDSPLAINEKRLSITNSFTVVVNEVNRAPVLTAPAPQTINELATLSVPFTATDPDQPANRLTFELVSAPPGVELNPATGVLTWTPNEGQGPGTNTIVARVLDDGVPSMSATNSLVVVVKEVNSPPVWTPSASYTVNELEPLTINNLARDADLPANALTYKLVSGPIGVSLDGASGVFSWTPTEAQGPNTYTVTVMVTDLSPEAVNEKNMSITNSFTVTVKEVNQAPVLTAPATQTINELATLTLALAATDPDTPTNALTFDLVSAPAGVELNPVTGMLTWTPTETQGPGTNTITVRVSDNGAPSMSATNSFAIVVNEVNTPPQWTVALVYRANPQAVLTITNLAIDADRPANVLTYNLASGPAGAAVDAASGVFSWMPAASQAGTTNTFTVVVTDHNPLAVNEKNLSVTNHFVVEVAAGANQPPSLAVPSTQTVDELTTLTVTLTATDPDQPANVLTFGLVSAPAGVQLNPVTGMLAWTPTETQGPGTNAITVRVFDNGAPSMSATNSFTVIVKEVNSAPALRPIPGQKVAAGGTVNLLAEAVDLDIPNQSLTWSLEPGAPAGASINPDTGRFIWTPTTAQTPSTNAISIRVRDNGLPSLSDTQTFTVVVSSAVAEIRLLSISRPSAGSVTMLWTATPGSSYRMQYKTNLSDKIWLDLPGDVAATNSTAAKTDATLGASRQRYYRVQLLP